MTFPQTTVDIDNESLASDDAAYFVGYGLNSLRPNQAATISRPGAPTSAFRWTTALLRRGHERRPNLGAHGRSILRRSSGAHP